MSRRAGIVGRSALCLLLAAPIAGCFQPTVVRMVEGRAITGRYISPAAYTYYAFGADAEARGNLAYALEAYEAALADDGESVEVWTRIGLVRCLLDRDDAEEAFGEAEDADPDFASLWRERARCALHRAAAGEALIAVNRSVALDPGDVSARVLRADVLAHLGQAGAATRELHVLTLEKPRNVAAWRARYAHAERRGDVRELTHSAARLLALAPREAPSVMNEVVALGPLRQIDAALIEGDLATAHRLGRRVDLVLADIAARAAALGRVDLALDQSELILRADPSSSTARMVLAAAADMAGDPERLGLALGELPPSTELAPPSLLARALFAELLYRRVSAEAARAFWSAGGPTTPDDAGELEHDSLTAGILDRLEAKLQVRQNRPTDG